MAMNETPEVIGSNSALVEDVRAWLDRNGYRLEMTTAGALLALKPGLVEQGRQYVDVATGRLREFDVRATWWVEDDEGGSHALSFVIECKNTKSPWVLFVGGDDLTWDTDLPINGVAPACDVCADVVWGVVAESVRNIDEWGYAPSTISLG